MKINNEYDSEGGCACNGSKIQNTNKSRDASLIVQGRIENHRKPSLPSDRQESKARMVVDIRTDDVSKLRSKR